MDKKQILEAYKAEIIFKNLDRDVDRLIEIILFRDKLNKAMRETSETVDTTKGGGG